MIEPVSLQLGPKKEEERHDYVESFSKAGWKQWCSGNGLWLADRPSTSQNHYPSQDVLQSWQGKVGAFHFYQRCKMEEECLGCGRSFTKWGGRFGVCERAVASIQWSTSQWSPLSAQKVYYWSFKLYSSWMDLGHQTDGLFVNRVLVCVLPKWQVLDCNSDEFLYILVCIARNLL